MILSFSRKLRAYYTSPSNLDLRAYWVR